jgi:hypothetical protein
VVGSAVSIEGFTSAWRNHLSLGRAKPKLWYSGERLQNVTAVTDAPIRILATQGGSMGSTNGRDCRTMGKSSTHESPPQRSGQPQPRRNVYDYDGEYEFVVARHWITRETLTNTASVGPQSFFS